MLRVGKEFIDRRPLDDLAGIHHRDLVADFGDNAEIHLDYDLEAEDALFILVHLFGHTVQWNTSEEARAIGRHTGPWDDAHLIDLTGGALAAGTATHEGEPT